MYSLDDSLLQVKGIGPKTYQKLKQQQITTVKDLLLYLPLRYDDRSHQVSISQLAVGQTYTIKAQVKHIKEYFKNRTRITQATVADGTGQTRCVWFNNRFIKHQIKPHKTYYFSGPYSKYRSLTQPAVEKLDSDKIHTGRIVPLYSSSLGVKQGYLRRWLKELTDHLQIEGLADSGQVQTDQPKNPTANKAGKKSSQDWLAREFDLLDLTTCFQQIHFPEKEELVVSARKRLAIEELLALIEKSHQIKQQWQQQNQAVKIKINNPTVPDSVPFQLTTDQQQAVSEILADLQQTTPMNRLLIGDVGSGKTVVAGLACKQVIANKQHAALIAPTKILAQQHLESLSKLFPDLSIQLITGDSKTEASKTKRLKSENSKSEKLKSHSCDKQLSSDSPTLFIGTHAVINQLPSLQPALIVYDEQHRFGVSQREEGRLMAQPIQPHILTMSATPIPRSYMLTIFSHLDVSQINQLPFGEKPIKTWLVPHKKRSDAYDWLVERLTQKQTKSKNTSLNSDSSKKTTLNPNKNSLNSNDSLALIVCPVINPSDQQIFKDIPSAIQLHQELTDKYQSAGLTIGLLHGQQKPEKQQQIIQKLYQQQINLLVSTSIVEVGVDLPTADLMVIEGADRFGLASLHQLRGRVGRQGQASYCLLFSYSQNSDTKQRLQQFTQTQNGFELAEIDLKNRGAGDLFGLEQHGLDQLKFGSWNNLELIGQAQKIYQYIKQKQDKRRIKWQPLIEIETEDRAQATN